MLFILGLTFFVAVIAQTRILESLSFRLLARNRGGVVPTVAMIAFVVSFASGILDGVSMIGLMIRTLVIILFLAKVTGDSVVYSVMVSTVCTTVCGMWLAYGEPPNLIMKANLFPYLDNAFFLRYCLPVALASYGVVFFNVSRKLKGRRVDTAKLDILDLHTADVRFLQASRHGEVLTPVGFVEDHPGEFGERLHPVLDRLHRGEPLGQAMIAEGIDPDARRRLLGHFVWEPLAETLDRHYEHAAKGGPQSRDESAAAIKAILAEARKGRVRSQLIGGISFVPFIGFLVWHALDHHVPLFAASFAGFAVALFGIIGIRAMRRLALREAAHEYSEYLFLFPLFFSIALLQKAGFFEAIARALLLGVEKFGAAHMAAFQFAGATFLSAMLDNNVVADFAGRAIHGLGAGLIHLFAMAQIAGYAVGGCWTHIGSAQSVVAYAFIRKEIDERYNPFQWIRAMTPVILEIFVLAVVIVYIEGFLYGSR
ncbi:MAG: hypothetical protein A2636_03200 [Elusimicrobia bacterium RIFCSPHIGHO2_01_FULL_64_10]|nr:MAG: hypothetical protein A2636_03200 [Elusimicrobia bacterium RIFCSPHIGHO2_01_FULL_64_10]